MKKKFVSGVIAGAFLSMLVFTVFLSFYLKGEEDTAPNSGLLSGESQGKVPGNEQKEKENEEKTTKVSEAALEKKITYIKRLIDRYYMGEVTEEDYQTWELRSLLYALDDPYSCYYTPEEYDELMESSNGTYCGIGALVSQNVKTGVITIVKPFVDGPAYKAGMLPGDIIYKVEGEEVTGVDISKVVGEMKGERGTKVTVEVVREGESSPIVLEIIRDDIEVPTVEYKMMEDNIGYIYVMEFDVVTAEQFIGAIDKLLSQGMKGLVIDIRDNPGGLLDTVVAMLDRMLPEGLIVYTEDKNGNQEKESSDAKEFNLPLAVLINGNSASASEIFAGAIQDYEKGTIVGTQSFGKGIVQSVIPLYDGSAVKMTVAYYFTPKGRNIHGIGITPDVEVELEEGLSQKVVLSEEEDNQLQKAIEVVKEKIAGTEN